MISGVLAFSLEESAMNEKRKTAKQEETNEQK